MIGICFILFLIFMFLHVGHLFIIIIFWTLE